MNISIVIEAIMGAKQYSRIALHWGQLWLIAQHVLCIAQTFQGQVLLVVRFV